MRTLLILLAAGSVTWWFLGGDATPETGSSEEASTSSLEIGKPTREQIESAVQRGLQWLARAQMPQGCWTGTSGHKRGDGYIPFFTDDWQRARGRGHVGVTALAGLAFLADGQIPGRGRYGDTMHRVVDYLLDATGGLDYLTDSGTRMYSHAFAVLFLSQLHGMTSRRGAEIHEKLRVACRFIEQSQNEFGGWRYTPGTDEADLSVTVCQVQALRAARNVGTRVSKATIDRVIEYIRRSRIESGPNKGAFYYKIYGTAARTKTSFAVNGAAVTALHSAGVYDDREYGRALFYIEDAYDEISAWYPNHYYYWYGNYYAAQAFHLEGGARWDRYWAKLSRDLVARQNPDGSWNNDVGPGREFSTAIACLLLRIPVGYLPIFHS